MERDCVASGGLETAPPGYARIHFAGVVVIRIFSP